MPCTPSPHLLCKLDRLDSVVVAHCLALGLHLLQRVRICGSSSATHQGRGPSEPEAATHSDMRIYSRGQSCVQREAAIQVVSNEGGQLAMQGGWCAVLCCCRGTYSSPAWPAVACSVPASLPARSRRTLHRCRHPKGHLSSAHARWQARQQ